MEVITFDNLLLILLQNPLVRFIATENDRFTRYLN
jgi:hypothetical protein